MYEINVLAAHVLLDFYERLPIRKRFDGAFAQLHPDGRANGPGQRFVRCAAENFHNCNFDLEQKSTADGGEKRRDCNSEKKLCKEKFDCCGLRGCILTLFLVDRNAPRTTGSKDAPEPARWKRALRVTMRKLRASSLEPDFCQTHTDKKMGRGIRGWLLHRNRSLLCSATESVNHLFAGSS